MPVYHGIRPWDSAPCSICLTMVQNPHNLQCSHRFCQSCVNHQLSRLSTLLEAGEKITIACQHCREFFHLTLYGTKPRPATTLGIRKPEYTPNVVSTPFSIKEDARASHGRMSKRCQPCLDGGEYEEAVFWCQNCSEYFCFSCTQYHKALKMSKAHIIKSIVSKEKYEAVKSKVAEVSRSKSLHNPPKSARYDIKVATVKCEPCNANKKLRDARYLCDTCQEKLCKDCSKCHRTMKISKTHKLVSLHDLLHKPESTFSLGLQCDKHKDEVLSLFCKRCQTSCCSICAIKYHSNCTQLKAPASLKPQNKPANTTGINSSQSDLTKLVKFDAKATAKAPAAKASIPRNEMMKSKSRIVVCAASKGEWVISFAILSTGAILAIELYSTELKMLDTSGKLVSRCSFIGEAWSVAASSDHLAAITFSDRKQVQLVNITNSGLEPGKRMNTKHKSLAICFCKNLIVTTCWQGCLHAMDISGTELFSIDRDSTGNSLFSNPEYIVSDKIGTTVYVSDFKRDCLLAFTILPSRFESKPKFVFKHPELRGPKGVTVDLAGIVYLSGMTSRNIFRISPEGQLIQIYRRREDTDYYEDIGVSSDAKTLLVSAYQDNTLIKFTLK